MKTVSGRSFIIMQLLCNFCRLGFKGYCANMNAYWIINEIIRFISSAHACTRSRGYFRESTILIKFWKFCNSAQINLCSKCLEMLSMTFVPTHPHAARNTPVKPMMTSSNGNIFRVTGHLCGEFTGPGEFPTQRPVTRSFDLYFDLRPNIWLSKQ